MKQRPPVDAKRRDDELAWLAFRYVAGELPGNEAAVFETRLDHDQEAREAVAEAVGVVSALAGSTRPADLVLVSGPDTTRGQRGARRVALVFGGLAAALVLLTLSLGRFGPGRPSGGDADLRTLALTWSGLWQTAEADLDGTIVPGAADTPATEPASARTDALVAWLGAPAAGAPHGPEGDEADAEAPPLWMLEAASLGAAGEASEPGS